MPRDVYTNTFAIADPATGVLTGLPGIEVYIYKPGTKDQAFVYADFMSADNDYLEQPVRTSENGLITFYAEAGEYDLLIQDGYGQPRIKTGIQKWHAVNAGNQGISSSMIKREGGPTSVKGLDLFTLAGDVWRQFVPIGQVIDWWRPAPTVPLPPGFQPCDGRTIPADEHDFGTGNAITLPDLRNQFIIGADVLKPDGAASTNGDSAAGPTVQHLHAPGIRGTGGQNRAKDLSHKHDISHTHGVPFIDHTHTGTLIAHTHSGTAPDHLHETVGGTLSGGSHYHTFRGGADLFLSSRSNPSGDEMGAYIPSPWGDATGGARMDSQSIGITGKTGASDRYVSGGMNFTTGDPSATAYETASAKNAGSLGTTTNSQTNTDGTTNTMGWGTLGSTPGTYIDMRPAHVGLLKLMKVRRN